MGTPIIAHNAATIIDQLPITSPDENIMFSITTIITETTEGTRTAKSSWSITGRRFRMHHAMLIEIKLIKRLITRSRIAWFSPFFFFSINGVWGLLLGSSTPWLAVLISSGSVFQYTSCCFHIPSNHKCCGSVLNLSFAPLLDPLTLPFHC